ncbi:MAG: hypothetical protein AABZ10_03745 [Nitrospirota bacterium]
MSSSRSNRALEESLFGETEESGLPAKMPERYVRIALDACLMGKITVSRLAELLNKDVFELRKALAESGLTREAGAPLKNILLENYKERFPLAPILCYYLIKGIKPVRALAVCCFRFGQ